MLTHTIAWSWGQYVELEGTEQLLEHHPHGIRIAGVFPFVQHTHGIDGAIRCLPSQTPHMLPHALLHQAAWEPDGICKLDGRNAESHLEVLL